MCLALERLLALCFLVAVVGLLFWELLAYLASVSLCLDLLQASLLEVLAWQKGLQDLLCHAHDPLQEHAAGLVQEPSLPVLPSEAVYPPSPQLVWLVLGHLVVLLVLLLMFRF